MSLPGPSDGKFFGKQLRLPYNKEASSSGCKRSHSTLDWWRILAIPPSPGGIELSVAYSHD
ncbi:4948_t:CDS:2 [Paraglomus occultum]|uniref:4948_t:CDS:1 n=1 Tax=Paraglomus occultum TaxID=144539 RepID=A0A9N9ATG3_9GLOM|nr:4948_t:CDS:2 [Paraglomus occultum]